MSPICLLKDARLSAGVSFVPRPVYRAAYAGDIASGVAEGGVALDLAARDSRSEFNTTVTELIAIAPAAAMGFKKPTSPRIGCRTLGTVPSENTG